MEGPRTEDSSNDYDEPLDRLDDIRDEIREEDYSRVSLGQAIGLAALILLGLFVATWTMAPEPKKSAKRDIFCHPVLMTAVPVASDEYVVSGCGEAVKVACSDAGCFVMGYVDEVPVIEEQTPYNQRIE